MEAFNGEIGHNMFYTKEEREEDVLETLYLWWREGKPIRIPDICIEFDMTKRELSYIIKQMVKHGYVRRMEKDGGLELTSFGKAQGAECLARHQHLTQFIQMICGLDENLAEENACRMEHVVSGDVIHGICDFMKYGDSYDRIVRNANLRFFYDEGEYDFCMGIYRAEKRYPRGLADEYGFFSDEIHLKVGNEKSSFYLKKISDKGPEYLWYKAEFGWKQAESTARGFQIPTDVLTFTFGSRMLVMEGYGMIGFSDSRNTPPDSENYRELNVHIW